MTKLKITAVLGRGRWAILVGLLTSHCGRLGYDNPPVTSSLEEGAPSHVGVPSDVGIDADAGGADDDGVPPAPDAGDDSPALPAIDAGAAGTIVDAGSALPTPDAATPDSAQVGLIGHWKVYEGSGSSLADASGHGNAGVLEGATWSTSARGNVLTFSDQKANHVSVAASTSLDGIDAGVTIAAWVYTLGSGWEQVILARQLGASSDQRYALSLFQQSVQVQMGSDKLSHTLSPLPTQSWFHVACSYDGQTAKLYLNGVEVGSTKLASKLGSDHTPVLLGAKREQATVKSALNGRLDDVRLYQRALSAAEIMELAQ